MFNAYYTLSLMQATFTSPSHVPSPRPLSRSGRGEHLKEYFEIWKTTSPLSPKGGGARGGGADGGELERTLYLNESNSAFMRSRIVPNVSSKGTSRSFAIQLTRKKARKLTKSPMIA